jgi:hypothetical protein
MERLFDTGGGEKEGFLPSGKKIIYTVFTVFVLIRKWGPFPDHKPQGLALWKI